jgi:hypothetical protein
MSRTTRNWCPRSTMPPLPPLIEVDDYMVNNPHTNSKLANEAMTWQQEQDFGITSVSEGASSFPYRFPTAP